MTPRLAGGSPPGIRRAVWVIRSERPPELVLQPEGRSLPALLAAADPAVLVRDMLADLREQGRTAASAA